jgi:hypothetical protein
MPIVNMACRLLRLGSMPLFGVAVHVQGRFPGVELGKYASATGTTFAFVVTAFFVLVGSRVRLLSWGGARRVGLRNWYYTPRPNSFSDRGFSI